MRPLTVSLFVLARAVSTTAHANPAPEPPATEAAPVTLERRWPAYLPWTIATVGVVVAGTSVPLFMSANDDIDERDRIIEEMSMGIPMDEPAEARDLRDSATNKQLAGSLLFVTGATAATVGLVMAFLNYPKPTASGPAVTVMPDRGGGHVLLRADF